MTLVTNASSNQPISAAFRSHWWRLTTAAALVLLVLPAGACSKNSTSTSTTTTSQADTADDPTVATVNGIKIRQSDLVLAESDLGENVHQMDPATKREQLIAYLTDVILISQEAQKRNLQNDPDLKKREEFARNKLLMGLMLQTHVKTQATDEELRKVYDEAMKSMAGEEEVRARHILVETEDEAKAILEQIKGGADFAELAKEKSKDPSAKEGGGDLGYFAKNQMVPEFAEVAFKMFPGQLSNPVKTQFGWHIIKLEDKRTKQPPPFELVKDQIFNYVARRAQAEFVAQLRETAKIERTDKPAPAPIPQMQTPAPTPTPAPAPQSTDPAPSPEGSTPKQ